MPRASLATVVALRPEVADQVRALRAEGATHEKIARAVTDTTGVEVGREAVRIWLLEQEESA